MMNSLVDLFKLFKVSELKQVEKKGQVKWTHEKILGRKVLQIQGNVSTANYVKFPQSKPKQPLNQRYLYMQCLAEQGHIFSIVLTVHCSARIYKLHLSSLHKSNKIVNNCANLCLSELPLHRWTILVLDIHEMAREMIPPNEIKLSFELVEIELRATMRVKGMYMSDKFFSVEQLPKDIALPLHGQQLFFDKYRYSVYPQNAENIDNSNVKPQLRESRSADKKKQEPTKQANSEPQIAETKKVKFAANNEEELAKPRNPPLPRPKQQKPKLQQEIHTPIEDNYEMPLPLPKPSVTLEAHLAYHHGAHVAIGKYWSLGHILFTPQPIQTHKTITTFHRLSPATTILAYDDGTVSYFDTMMKQPVRYFQTGLQAITGIHVDKTGVLLLTGHDYMKRNILMLIDQNTILFKQICNYDVKGAIFISDSSYTKGILTFGYENIRVWKVKKQVIAGTCVYLGEFSRKVQYSSAIMTNNDIAYVVCSKGNLSKLSCSKGQIQEVSSLDEQSLDHIKQLTETTLLTVNEIGTVRIYEISTMSLLMEIGLHHRVKQVDVQSANELILTHYNKTVGRLQISEGKYQFLMRSHSDQILSLQYQRHFKRLITMSRDGSIRMWRIFADSLSQEYQFDIKDCNFTAMRIFTKDMSFLVGFESGLFRKFDMKECRVVDQKQYHKSPICSIDISKGDQYVLTADTMGNILLLDNQLEILSEYEGIPQDNMIVGFNKRTPYFYMTTTKLQITVVSVKTLKTAYTVYHQSTDIKQIYFDGELLHILTKTCHTIYKNNKFDRMFKLEQHLTLDMSFPLQASCHINNMIRFRILGSNIKEEIKVLEEMEGVLLPEDDDEGLMFTWGAKSHAIYCWRIKTHNLPKLEQMQQEEEEYEPVHLINNDLEVTFMEDVKERPQTLIQVECQAKPHFTQQQLCQTRRHSTQQYLQQNNEFLEASNDKPSEHLNSLTPILLYGYSLNSQLPLSSCPWNNEQRYVVLPSNQYLIVQYFSQPIRQRIIKLPFKADHLNLTPRYLSTANNNCVILYSSDTLTHFKSITFQGNKILSYTLSCCNNYIITLVQSNSKIILTVVEIVTSRIVTCSYLNKTERSTVIVNHLKPQQLQFVVLTFGTLTFYRVTSIQTLEYQEVDLRQLLSKSGSFLCATFVCLKKDEILLLGTTNGSIIVVDARTATPLVLCCSIVKSPVCQIKLTDDGYVMLVSNTVNMYLWKEVYGLQEFVSKLGDDQPHVLTLDAAPCLTSETRQNKILMVSKMGVLWLVDTTERVTVKLMSCHTKGILTCDVVGDCLISGSADCSVKVSNLEALQQTSQFYKPRKIVNCLTWHRTLNMLVAAHGAFLGFYSAQLVLGSCQFEKDIVSIQELSNTRNILVGTVSEIFMIYVTEDTEFRIQMHKLTDVPQGLQQLAVSSFDPYDVWLSTSKNGKINVWTRKCLKRLYDPIEQLSNVHSLEYYLVDNYQPKAIGQSTAHFLSTNNYLCASHEAGRLQQRNFRQHIIARDIEVSPMSCLILWEDRLIAGDKEGQVSILDRNGMMLERVKMLNEGIRGLKVDRNRLYVYGDRLMQCHIG